MNIDKSTWIVKQVLVSLEAFPGVSKLSISMRVYVRLGNVRLGNVT